MDESGDLGFSERSSRYVVFALVIVQDPKGIGNSLKQAKVRVLQRKSAKMPELKFNELSPEQRVRILKKITKKNFSICAIVLKKETVENNEFLRANAISCYLIDQLTGYSVYNAAKTKGSADANHERNPFALPVILTVDRYQSKRYYEEFENYLRRGYARRFNHQPTIQIAHGNSRDDLCLQLADLCAGSIFQKYEHGNEEYYNLLKDKILHEVEYFRNKAQDNKNK